MSTLRFPINTTSRAFTMTVQLEGLSYTLSFRYNARNLHWYMDVDYQGSRVLDQVRIVHSTDFLGQYPELEADDRLPPGTWLVTDATGADRDPDTDTFGKEVTMFYTES